MAIGEIIIQKPLVLHYVKRVGWQWEYPTIPAAVEAIRMDIVEQGDVWGAYGVVFPPMEDTGGTGQIQAVKLG